MVATLVSAVAQEDARLVNTKKGDRLVCQFRTINGEDATIWKPIEDEVFAAIRRNQSVKLVQDSRGWNLVDPSTVEPPTSSNITTDDLLVSLLDAIHQQTALLQQAVGKLDAPRLGLHDSAGAMRIYANRSNGCLWYTVTDGVVVPIVQAALTGYLSDISFPRVERRGKETVKLQITITGDRPYLVEAGHDSNFSKGFLSAVALLLPEQVRQPITISPQAGQDDSVLFCRVWSGGQLVKATYDDGTDWRLVAEAAIAAARSAR